VRRMFVAETTVFFKLYTPRMLFFIFRGCVVTSFAIRTF